MKRTVSLILAAVILLLFVSCGGEKNREYNEEEVKAAAEVLILKSAKLNDIFWGAGIPYEEDDNYKNGLYYPADFTYLHNLGAQTVDDILKLTAQVFTKGYTVSIYSSTFSSQTGDYGMAGYTRYYQGTECIMVYSAYKPLLTDNVEYITEELEVIGSKGQVVTVKLPIKVTRGGEVQQSQIEVNLIEEDEGWRIDSPTYAVFIEEIPNM